MPTVHVLFLGPAVDLVGLRECDLPIPNSCTVTGLRAALCERFPVLASPVEHMRIAVNQSLVEDDCPVRSGDEVALIPPVSGGSDEPGTWVELMPRAIPLDRVRAFIAHDSKLGGITTFEGVTRAQRDQAHGELRRLEYESYEGMALRTLQDLATTAQNRYGARRAVILHRTGGVQPGETSVVIAVACVHRAEAFEACRWLIDTLKTDVPIWKKEVFADGFSRWVDPTRSVDDTRVAGDTRDAGAPRNGG